jgi:hypothetical protein
MNSLSLNKSIHSTFPDPVEAARRLFKDGAGGCSDLVYVDHALEVLRAFQRDTINTLANCLVREAARLESTNDFVRFEDLKREAQALRDYAETLAPAAPEATR